MVGEARKFLTPVIGRARIEAAAGNIPTLGSLKKSLGDKYKQILPFLQFMKDQTIDKGTKIAVFETLRGLTDDNSEPIQ
ncbi:MAG: hypothetical protein Q8O87_02400 [bacterium]|nr:hypothetical protein [bacterium]